MSSLAQALAAPSDFWRLASLAPLACAVAAFCTPLARRWALDRDIVDHPRSGTAHAMRTPYLGGTAIVGGCVIAGLVVPGWTRGAAAVAVGAVLMLVIGLLDDLHELRPATRLAVETAAALAAAAVGARVDLFGNAFDWVLTVAWLVVLTNSFNLLDNMDGAAGAIATVTAVAVTASAALQGQVLVGGLAAVVAGATMGFLVHNWHPARIFMGDAGSLFLGYLLAVITLLLRFPTEHAGSIAAVVLFAAPCLFDTTLVVVSRIRLQQSIFVGGTDHTSHRLRRLGLPVGGVAVVLALGTAASCALGLLVGHGYLPALPLVASVALLAGIALVLLLRVPTRPATDAEERPVGLTSSSGGHAVLVDPLTTAVQ